MREVRAAGDGDADTVIGVLSRAFFDDPVAAFLFPDSGVRARRLCRFFELQVTRNYLRRGVVHLADGGAAAALWLPPGAPVPTFRERLAHLGFSMRLRSTRRAARALTMALESRHPHEPHWYLGAIGTEPERQGEGLASELLAAMATTFDQSGVSAYLEASTPESARLYERFGFEVQAHFDPKTLGIDGPQLILMRRRATSPRARDAIRE